MMQRDDAATACRRPHDAGAHVSLAARRLSLVRAVSYIAAFQRSCRWLPCQLEMLIFDLCVPSTTCAVVVGWAGWLCSSLAFARSLVRRRGDSTTVAVL